MSSIEKITDIHVCQPHTEYRRRFQTLQNVSKYYLLHPAIGIWKLLIFILAYQNIGNKSITDRVYHKRDS